MALTGEQAFYNAILPPDQENRRTFATLDDGFAPLVLIWWQAQEQPPAENPILPPRILTLTHVKLIRYPHRPNRRKYTRNENAAAAWCFSFSQRGYRRKSAISDG